MDIKTNNFHECDHMQWPDSSSKKKNKIISLKTSICRFFVVVELIKTRTNHLITITFANI